MLRGTALVALALTISACGGDGGPLGSIQVAEGTNVASIPADQREPAPSLAGEAVRPDDPAIADDLWRGKVAVVNFWGSWCGPCRLEEPLLEAAWKQVSDDGVVFVGVNTRRDQRAAAIAFLEEFDVTYPSVYDPTSAIAHAWRVRVMPATFVVDADGRIAAQIVGAIRSKAQLTDLIDEVA